MNWRTITSYQEIVLFSIRNISITSTVVGCLPWFQQMQLLNWTKSTWSHNLGTSHSVHFIHYKQIQQKIIIATHRLIWAVVQKNIPRHMLSPDPKRQCNTHTICCRGWMFYVRNFPMWRDHQLNVRLSIATKLRLYCTASLSHLRTMLPESSSRPRPANRPNHATSSLFDSKSLYS